MSAEKSTRELLLEAESSGNPKRIAAAAAYRQFIADWNAEDDAKAAVNAAQTALVQAEAAFVTPRAELVSALAAEERAAGLRIEGLRAEIATREEEIAWVNGPTSHQAKARAALANEDAGHAANVARLRAAVTTAQAAVDAVNKK